MKKKVLKKSAKKQTKTPVLFSSRYVVIAFGVVFALILGNFAIKGLSAPHVLGASTSNLIADQDVRDGQDGQQVPQQDTQQPHQENHPQQASGQNLPAQNPSTPSTTAQVVSPDTKVDCTGPDGNQFTTSFHDCQELNQKWGITNFLFTPLSTSGEQPDAAIPTPELQKTHDTIQTPQGSIEVQTEGTKGEFNLQGQGAQIQIKAEDNGSVSLTGQNQNGEKIALKSNAIEQINTLLGSEDIQVGTSSANGLEIADHNVVAHTTLPITIDPTTKTLAVTTPAGTKDVTVLPSQAVQQLIGSKIISNVLSQASSSNASSSAMPVIALTTVQNQLAFAIQGVSDKKLLGLFPIAYQKTVYVSAQNGQILHTSQSFLNQILQAISF